MSDVVSEPNDAPASKGLFFSEALYAKLKYLALIILPALATLYFAVSQIWGLPKGAEVVGTITALDTFLGLALRLSTKSYDASGAAYDGTMEVQTSEEGGKVFSLQLDSDPQDLDTKNQVTFKVNPT